MELGSMTQSSRSGFLAGMDESGGNLIGDNGLFTITSSFDWETDEGIETNPCLCSINYFAGFYDADGYGLMYMGGDHPGNVVTAPGLYPAAKHGFLLGYYYQGTDDFGLFVDATSPTATLRNFGSAKYASRIVGFMTGLDPATYVQMDTRITMTVAWGARPSLSGKIDFLYGHHDVVNSRGETVTTNYYELTTALTFHGTDWSEEHKSFHNGNIDCASRCQETSDSRSNWGGLLVDNGSGGVDPFRLVGTFGLYQYRLDGKLVDWIGFVYGETPFDLDELDRGLTDKPRSPGRALVRQVGAEVSDKLSFANSPDFLSTINSSDLDGIIRNVATMNSSSPSCRNAVPLYVDYSQNYPDVARPCLGFDWFYDVPIANVGGDPFANMPIGGNATYAGHAGGFYVTNRGAGGAFVSTIDLGVDFGLLQPTLSGTLGYDFNGVTGKLAMSGGAWSSSNASFSDGTLGCAAGCQDAGSFARWSAQFIDVTGMSIAVPAGVIGKFGANGILQQGNDEEEYRMYGIFAAVDSHTTGRWPAKSTFFPATPHGMLADAAGMYHRKDWNTGRRTDRYHYSRMTRTTVSVVKTPSGNFVHPGGTIQLASNLWDWRTDDYANCYCTMFLTGAAYDSNGKEIQGGLSSSPKLRWGSIDYTDAKHGWVGGMWRLDLLPSEWDYNVGRTQLGIFVAGTAPISLPTSGSAHYTGYGTGYAVPSTSTLAADYRSLRSQVSLDVNWGTGAAPSISGQVSLIGKFTQTTIWTGVKLSMGLGQWSATDRRFHSGSIGCLWPNCRTVSNTEGTWQGLFVETGDGGLNPGVFAGAYAMSRVSIYKRYGVNNTTTTIRMGLWDLYGWFHAIPSSEFDYPSELLKLPGRAVNAAIQDGFDVIYTNATPGQRQQALEAAGKTTIEVSAWSTTEERFGRRQLSGGQDRYAKTGFWTVSHRGNLSLGVFNTGIIARQPRNLPQTGGAIYRGNAMGFYKSSIDSGVMVGDVEITMRFLSSHTISAQGKMDFDIGGATGSFKMDHMMRNGWLMVQDADMTCETGCVSGSGSGKWGGHFTDTEAGRPDGGTPGGFIGSFGLDGMVIDNVAYDALGLFATVKQ